VKRKTLAIIGIVMLLLGAGMLVYRGFTVTREETLLNIGPLEVKATTKEHVPIPAPLGWILVVAGALVLVGGAVVKPS
jgi:ABC-type xylose transport system permease subunit